MAAPPAGGSDAAHLARVGLARRPATRCARPVRAAWPEPSPKTPNPTSNRSRTERARRGVDLRDRDTRDRRERLRPTGLADVRVARDREEDERLFHRDRPLVDKEPRGRLGRAVQL